MILMTPALFPEAGQDDPGHQRPGKRLNAQREADTPGRHFAGACFSFCLFVVFFVFFFISNV